jgi:hypothetical protein
MMFNPMPQTMHAAITQPWSSLWEDNYLGQVSAGALGLQRQTHPVVKSFVIFLPGLGHCLGAYSGVCGLKLQGGVD